MPSVLNRRRLVAACAVLLALAGMVSAPAALAARRAWHEVARFHIADPTDVANGFGWIWVLSGTEDSYAVLTRIDPYTNRRTGQWTYRDGGAGIAIAKGSVWISQYNANEVLRIDPDTGRVVARVHVGLQPESVHAAAGDVWVGNHHGQSVSRIEPATNKVIGTFAVGDPHRYRGGPQDITSKNGRVYVGASDTQALTTIGTRRDAVVSVWDTPSDQFCGDLHFVGSQLWSVDHCTNQLYHLRFRIRHARPFDYGQTWVNSIAVRDGGLWVAVDEHPGDQNNPPSGGALQARNPVSGKVRRTLHIGGDAAEIHFYDGTFWVVDPTAGAVRRIRVR